MKPTHFILFIILLSFDSLGNCQSTNEYSEKKLAYLSHRIQAEISKPLNQNLKIIQNPDAPEKEFIDGFNKILLTKGHPKSKGLDLQIRVPNSWSIQEGDRPNVIKKAVSQNGKGFEMVILIVSDIGATISSSQFTPELMKQFVTTGSKYISGKKVTLDRIEGGMIEFDQIVMQIDIKFKVRGLFL